MDKKIWIAIVVIAIAVIAGAFIAMKYSKGGEAATGQLTEVPEGETAEESAADEGKFSEIKEDMTKSQVISLVGEPTDKQTVKTPKGNVIEYWYYTDSNDNVWQIGFSNDAVSAIRKY